jgi:hypothetical protein
MTLRSAFLIFAACFIIFSSAFIDASGEPGNSSESEWVNLETGALSVYCDPTVDLDHVEAGLRKRAAYFSSDMPGEDTPIEDKIRYQIDALFRRAEDILDMRPTGMHINIRIFKTRKEVNDQYAKIFHAGEEVAENSKALQDATEFKAFYVDKFKTIYISEEDISDSILAHEMGHAIVDHYFAVIPPEKVRELLASYVDLHLAE